MKSLIGIKFVIEGMHCFPNASERFDSRVKFLESPHRHNFHFDCTVRVSHDDRDKEFILLKRELINFIEENFWNLELSCIDFESRSCESIARYLMENFTSVDFESIKVSEDNENYAILTKEEKDREEQQEKSNFGWVKKEQIKIEFVFGAFCSGKSTFLKCEKEEDRELKRPTQNIEIGDIVRSIKNESQRLFEEELDRYIVSLILDKIKKTIVNSEVEIIRIVGIRQLSIYLNILKGLSKIMIDYSVEFNFENLFLSCSKEERKKRFIKQSKESLKNVGLTFEQVEENERNLGWNSFTDYLVNNVCLKIISI